MAQAIPKGKCQRGLSGGKTAARMSRKALKYLARKPFLTEEKRQAEKKAMNRENAVLLFEGLSLLEGTALKIAQLLSMEMDIFPPEITKELQKSYHQVPPINRVLVRKTIQNDVQLIKTALRPLPEYRTILPAILEIETRLLEETDYARELDNLTFFKERLRMDRVIVPAPYGEYSADTVLSAEHINGPTLNEWLKTGPDPGERDLVAQTLQDLFIFGLYRLHRIHADPNPGSFIVSGDARVGLVDFGCGKRFDPKFVALSGELPRAALHGEQKDYMRLLKALRIAGPDIGPEVEEEMFQVFHETGRWLGRLYREDSFDFRANGDFIASGKKMMARAFELRKHADLNTNSIFLHRTRYGLLRLFERMGARVCFRNAHEYS